MKNTTFAVAAILVASGTTSAQHSDARFADPADLHISAATESWYNQSGYDGPYAVVRDPATPIPPFDFNAEDDALLEEITAATFRWFWEGETLAPNGLTKDRTQGPLISIAGLGYQLGAFVIGAERGYVTKEAAAERALSLLKELRRTERNRKAGFYFHFLHEDTMEPLPRGDGASTIDSSIMYAGVLTAAQYFGGEVAELGNAMFREADFSFFVHPPTDPAWKAGFMSMGWEPDDRANDPTGEGRLKGATWIDAMGEQRLIYFLAAAAPEAEHRLDPNPYYRMRRTMGTYRDLGAMARLPFAGGTFLAVFDQLWIDDASIGAAMGPDRPDLHGHDFRPPVDWWENSRRHAHLHRLKAIHEAPEGMTTLGPNAWGLTASDAPGGYRVPGVYPDVLPFESGARPDHDVPPRFQVDEWLDGTLAIYGAGMMVMFAPEISVDALRHYRNLRARGKPILWNDRFGFVDSYNMHIECGPWVAPERLSIDQGPLLIAIENARTGLIWDTLHAHPWIQAGMERLGLTRGDE